MAERISVSLKSEFEINKIHLNSPKRIKLDLHPKMTSDFPRGQNPQSYDFNIKLLQHGYEFCRKILWTSLNSRGSDSVSPGLPRENSPSDGKSVNKILKARQMVVDKMDKQFQADLNTRRGANALIKRSAQMYSDLVVLQKGYTSYNDILWDMRDNARRNRMAIGKTMIQVLESCSLIGQCQFRARAPSIKHQFEMSLSFKRPSWTARIWRNIKFFKDLTVYISSGSVCLWHLKFLQKAFMDKTPPVSEIPPWTP